MFFRCLSAEFLKMKRTLTLWLVLLVPFVVCFLYFMMVFDRGEAWLDAGANPWYHFYENVLVMWIVLMYPLFITLETTLLANIEHSDKHWKHLFALPVPRAMVYAVKWSVMVIMATVSMILLIVGSVAASAALSLLKPGINFAGSPVPLMSIVVITTKAFLISWLIIAIHTWISMRFKSFAFSSAVGICASAANLLLMNSEKYMKLFPWSMGVTVLTEDQSFVPYAIIIGVVGGLMVLLLGALDISRVDVL